MDGFELWFKVMLTSMSSQHASLANVGSQIQVPGFAKHIAAPSDYVSFVIYYKYILLKKCCGVIWLLVQPVDPGKTWTKPLIGSRIGLIIKILAKPTTSQNLIGKIKSRKVFTDISKYLCFNSVKSLNILTLGPRSNFKIC